MQASLVPRIACMRLWPPIAEQPLPGVAFVARRRRIVEISAARALQEVAARGGHVAQLLRGARPDGACEHRIALFDRRVIGEIGVAHERADAQAAAGRVFNLLQRQPRDIDQLRRTFDLHLHQIDQIGAAGDELRAWIAGDLAHGVRDIGGARILKLDHDRPIACWMAATMLV